MSPLQPYLAKRQDTSGTSAAEASPTETSNEPTPTPVPSSTASPTSSQRVSSTTPTTPTASATATATPTPTQTPTPSQTASQTLSLESETPSATASQSQTPTPSQTATQSVSESQSASASQTPSETATPSQSASQTASQPDSATPSASSSEAQTSPASQSPTSRAEQTSQGQVTETVIVTSRRTATQLPVSTREADTTARSSFFVTFTRSDGQLSTSAPSEFTSIMPSTKPDGGTVSVTQIIAQPTGALNPDGGGRGSSAFFQNKGAVAGVFLIVGIAGAAILAFLLLAYRRRRQHKQKERDTVLAAQLGPQSRVPFEDDDDDEPTNNSHGMTQRNPFAYVAGTPHAVGQHGEYLGAGKASYEPYDPYASYPVPTASSNGHQHSTAHTRIGSGGLGGYEYDYRHYQAPSATGGVPDPRTSPTSPRRAMSPTSGSSQAPTYAPGLGPSISATAGPSGQDDKRVSGADSASVYSVPEGSLIDTDDDQRDMLGMRLRGGVGSEGSLRDDEDYTRKVLTVTNAT